MGALSLIPLLMSVALLSRTALDMTREVTNQRKEERPGSVRSHNPVPAWGSKILLDSQQTEADFSDHQVTQMVLSRFNIILFAYFPVTG